MSILGLDLGEKRVGVAISRSGIIAEPYQLMEYDNNFLQELKKICRKEGVDKIIIGLPRSLSGDVNSQEKKIRAIAEEIKDELEIGIDLIDESYSTKIAQSRFGPRVDDKEAAVVILEGYLNKN